MNIEDFREYCLSFSGVYEKFPFEKATTEYDSNLLVFYVGDKWFCFVNIDVFDFCNVKCNPEESEKLQERYDGVKPGYHMNKKHWISIYFDRDVPDRTIKELVKRSYDLVANSSAKKKRKPFLL
ncbi:MAG: MmcQ/YjbR family DNA-binding protein [Bacteroidales bacterium]|nr:MmcQ/YjbR family DNA-binding protein [Bacteroidales bacterium]